MSKLSFRARALDASKPLPVFRCEDLPDLHEYASINRAVPQMPTGMEKEEESVCCFFLRRRAAGGWRFFGGAARRSRLAPLCCLRKPVQNGRHVCRVVHTRRNSRRTRAPGAADRPRTGTAGRRCGGVSPAAPVSGARFWRKRRPGAQRSHVTRVGATILSTLLFGAQASGRGLGRPRCASGGRTPGGDTEPPGPARRGGPRVDSSGAGPTCGSC